MTVDFPETEYSIRSQLKWQRNGLNWILLRKRRRVGRVVPRLNSVGASAPFGLPAGDRRPAALTLIPSAMETMQTDLACHRPFCNSSNRNYLPRDLVSGDVMRQSSPSSPAVQGITEEDLQDFRQKSEGATTKQ